jgi:hypothetical protein
VQNQLVNPATLTVTVTGVARPYAKDNGNSHCGIRDIADISGTSNIAENSAAAKQHTLLLSLLQFA